MHKTLIFSPLKQGGTFQVDALYQPTAGWPADVSTLSVACHLKHNGERVAVVTVTPAPGNMGWHLRVPASATKDWPTGQLEGDLAVGLPDGSRKSSKTFICPIERAITEMA